VVFLLAGLYNIGWGIFSALDPQWLFRFAGRSWGRSAWAL